MYLSLNRYLSKTSILNKILPNLIVVINAQQEFFLNTIFSKIYQKKKTQDFM